MPLSTPRVLPALLVALVLAPGCHKDSTTGSDLAGAIVDGGDDLAGAISDGSSACPRLPRPADAARAIVISHPFSEPSGAKAKDYEVLALDAAGVITRPGRHFTMGNASSGEIVFTPDGAVGFVAQEQGSIGVFRLSADQTVTVVSPELMPGPYAGRLVVAPTGDRLYVLDDETENNGGGVYDLAIHCDGSLGAASLLSAADLPYTLVGLPGGKHGLYARALAGAAPGESAHVVTLGPPFQRLASVPSFPVAGNDAIVSSSAVTSDGRYLLFGDNSMFSSEPNRLAAIEVTNSGLRAAQVLAPINDAVSIVSSPYNNAALVSSGFDNALIVLGYHPSNATTPFTSAGKLTPVGASPELPGSGVVITRGTLKGRVYVAENLGVRQVRFETDGKVNDLGRYPLGMGLGEIVGAIGVQP